MINKVSLFDTSIATENLGDKIIMDSVMGELKNIFERSFYVHVPTHDRLGFPSYKHLKTSDFRFVCGTNLLSSNMPLYNQWKINLIDAPFLNDIILLGVGWWQYQKKPNLYTRFLLKNILSKSFLHSVRDSYTKDKLNSIGIQNVINTGCPTMWGLNQKHCKDIPQKKSENVLMTLTNYNKEPELDKNLIDILLKNYKKVFFWIQAYEDYIYLKKLGYNEYVEIIPPTLDDLDDLLSCERTFDYIGTRLHAGIRALNFKRRTIIISIDNRAKEKAKDFNINIIERNEINTKLEKKLRENFNTEIDIPEDKISKWKNQFS